MLFSPLLEFYFLGYDSIEDVKINILPLNCVPDLSRKAKYKQLFDVIYFSNR